ncbi:MAG: hypothetical protein ACK5UQ_14260 [Planctomycetota bacterium]
MHDAQHLAWAFLDGVAAGVGGQQVEHQHRALGELAVGEPGGGGRVRLRPTAKGKRLLAQLPGELLQDALPSAAATADLAEALTALLRAMQRGAGGRSFGVCRTCRHFRSEDGGARCGLTGEPLPTEQTERLCREHAFPGSGGKAG